MYCLQIEGKYYGYMKKKEVKQDQKKLRSIGIKSTLMKIEFEDQNKYMRSVYIPKIGEYTAKNIIKEDFNG